MLFVGAKLIFNSFRLQKTILGVVALVCHHFLVLNVPNGGANFVQKVSVVGNNKQRALGGKQKVFQPIEGFVVQVVGGLVQNHQFRTLQKQFTKCRFGLFATGKCGYNPIGKLHHTHAVKHSFDLDFHRVGILGVRLQSEVVILA